MAAVEDKQKMTTFCLDPTEPQTQTRTSCLTSNVVERDDDSSQDLPRVTEGPQAELLVSSNTCGTEAAWLRTGPGQVQGSGTEAGKVKMLPMTPALRSSRWTE